MKSCLVVYYSRTGMTHEIASKIATDCGCDIEQIRDTRKRSGILGFLRCAYEAILGKMPNIIPTTKNPDDYGVVILGTPVWAARISSPMRSYIHENAGRFNKIAAFCTMGGSGGEKVLDEIAALCGKTPIARLALTDEEIQRNRYQEKFGLFTQGVLEAPG